MSPGGVLFLCATANGNCFVREQFINTELQMAMARGSAAHVRCVGYYLIQKCFRACVGSCVKRDLSILSHGTRTAAMEQAVVDRVT
ncbi:hypothetical protein CEXT_779561 [Caerostris extrusa]|uniref:Secreted protein n=1 Tax=Caerostris extrusa TaxID=172846 RepID=A0AAV4XXA9_CAEEX|nr:hypothetical protein CEXT_779561 [Caerostris extrusa]